MPGPQTVVHANDILIVKGAREEAERAQVDFNLGLTEVTGGSTALSDVLVSPEVGVAEVMLAPRSQYTGLTLTEAQIAQQYGVQVLSILRANRILPRATTQLQFGDALLVRGAWNDIAKFRIESDNFVVVGLPESMATQIARFTLRSWLALGALGLMVVLMVTSAVPTVMAVLIAAMIMVLFKCLPLENVYRAINWPTVVLIAATLPLSTALQVTGGAQVIVDTLVSTVGAMGPIPLMAAIFLLTAGFSQVISNTATTVLVAPIVLQMAMNLGLSPYPLLAVVAVGASAAFLTPIASPVNTLVMTPGGYRFNDYVKVGLPLLLIAMVLALLLAPVFWPL
ncbi:MAG: anion permease [Anaerolineales bacterium]|nr:anion permease [Anaerolineales bacterium]